MIDTRDHIGVPVITTCPTYVKHAGVTYEIAADALVVRESDLRTQWLEDALWEAAATPWQREYLNTPIRTPQAFTPTAYA